MHTTYRAKKATYLVMTALVTVPEGTDLGGITGFKPPDLPKLCEELVRGTVEGMLDARGCKVTNLRLTDPERHKLESQARTESGIKRYICQEKTRPKLERILEIIREKR